MGGRGVSYTQYHQWLFPGDPVLEPNPLDADATADELLAEVSCRTGIEVSWLRRSVREVLDGLAGLGCLWFLHGARGQVAGKIESTLWLHALVNYIHGTIYDDPSEQKRGLTSAFVHELNWLKGNVTFTKSYGDAANLKAVNQTFKLGKHIDAFVAHRDYSEDERKAMHHDLKWRAKAYMYDFVVSCSPYDVLTMSHGRPWPSCMKPGGMFEFGPLTDMAAGSAIVWFYAQGADVPAGRIILRPFTVLDFETGEYRPHIATGGRLYGSGPDIGLAALNKMLEPWLQGVEIDHVELCPIGQEGYALTRAIYSDTDRAAEGCKQDQEAYAEAYSRLGHSDWPEPKFDLGVIGQAAFARAESYEYRGASDEDEEEEDEEREEELNEANRQLLQDGTENIVDWYLVPSPSMLEIYTVVVEPDALRPYVTDYINNTLENDTNGDYYAFSEYDEEPAAEISDDLYDVLWHGLVEHLNRETDYMFGCTASAEQAAELQRVILKTGNSELVQAYPPGRIPEKVLDELNVGVKGDAYFDWEYPEESMKRSVDWVFLMPEWFYKESSALNDFINNATTLYSYDAIETGDMFDVDPYPLNWLQELMDRAS
jgi:hypothetical protein